MRLRNTIILLLIAAAGLIYFFVIEQPRHERKMKEIERSTRITDLKREDIYYVTIRRDNDTLKFTREGDTWWITAPVKDKANTPVLNTLVLSALGAEIDRSIAPGEGEAADFGLGPPPAATLRLQTASKDTSLTIDLGGHNITKSHFYARVHPSEEVLLLPAGLRRYALLDLSDLRDRRLIDFTLEEVERLRTASAKRVLLWEKDAGNRWTAVVGGDTIMGNQKKIDAILRRLRGIRVKNFLSDDPADRPLYFPGETDTLSFWTGNEMKMHSVYFSARNADTCCALVAGGDRIVSISSEILGAFGETYDDLRDRNILHFDRNEVAGIRLITSDTTATILRSGSEWAFANPLLGNIDQARVNELFLLLKDLRFGEIIENRFEASPGRTPGKPSFRLALYDGEKKLLDEFTCFPEREGESSVLATSLSSKLLGRLNKDRLVDLERTFRSLRSK